MRTRSPDASLLMFCSCAADLGATNVYMRIDLNRRRRWNWSFEVELQKAFGGSCWPAAIGFCLSAQFRFSTPLPDFDSDNRIDQLKIDSRASPDCDSDGECEGMPIQTFSFLSVSGWNPKIDPLEIIAFVYDVCYFSFFFFNTSPPGQSVILYTRIS